MGTTPSPAKAFTEATKACKELRCLDSLPSHPDTEYLVLSSDANDTSFGGLLASNPRQGTESDYTNFYPADCQKLYKISTFI